MLKRIRNTIIENRLIIAAGLISIAVAYLPYVRKDLVIGSDWSFHLIRIETLATALSRGEFPVKFHSDLCYGFGYGVGFFYSNLFLYIPAVLMNLGFSLEVAYKLFAGLIFCALFVGMFVSIWQMTEDKYTAVAAAVSYVLSVSVLESFYQHFATGRSLALIFMPMALCGMYLLLSQNRGRELLEIGFIGLIYAHVLSTLLSVIVCFIFALLLIKEWITNGQKWKNLLLAIGVVLAFTAAYWMPLMEQWLAQTYRASQPWTYVDENVISAFSLLSDSAIGKLLLVLALVLGFWIIEKNCSKKIKVFWGTGVGLFLLTTVYDFWHLFRNVFKFLQFPYRLFSIVTVLLIVALALWLRSFSFDQNKMKILIVILLALNICYAYQYMNARTSEVEDLGYRVLHEEIAGLGAGEEWLPVETTRDYLVDPLITQDSDGRRIEGSRDGNYYILPLENKADYCDVPFVWYKGFAAVTDTGTELEVMKNPETGLVRIETSRLAGGEQITVWYKGTGLQMVSYVITLLVVVAWIGKLVVGWISGIKNVK